ncbi:MAG: hypothetical protein SV765_05505 [Pseudomonadota bacterium]|nr:hypothetical protein [Pseudomonadales bacterium]MDY6919654.1 hypothetical protein [Pseudomonadota bacterium]
MVTKYYLAFASSKELEDSAADLIARHHQGVEESYIPLMEDTMDYFIPEMLDAFLVKSVDAIGLSSTSSKIVHSSADIIGKSARMLIPHLLKKRSNQELGPMVDFMDEIYLRPEQTETGQASSGCELDQATYERMRRVLAEVKAGKVEENRQELSELMSQSVDLMLDGLMKRAINLLKQGFVVRKIADGALSTCRAAAHGVVNKVFKRLEDHKMQNLAAYFEGLVITAQRPES